jgi:hypothetical protein
MSASTTTTLPANTNLQVGGEEKKEEKKRDREVVQWKLFDACTNLVGAIFREVSPDPRDTKDKKKWAKVAARAVQAANIPVLTQQLRSCRVSDCLCRVACATRHTTSHNLTTTGTSEAMAQRG